MASAAQSADQLSETADVSRNFDDLTLKASDRVPALKGMGKTASSSVMKVDHKGHPAAVARETPLPRINCASVVRNNTLYIYGGLLEVGDREVSWLLVELPSFLRHLSSFHHFSDPHHHDHDKFRSLLMIVGRLT